uniref:Uncharacterized protein n=1 Tax=Cryptomonas curvata TaxID=233186 RepID=A0A7S0MYC7_9CRYP|mmetsp:Transcript_57491/g.120228  ORF Transcript_57491/g.120228 Transcript_57491/m.120228 type:complete len:141 (+) Transcript_57491:33-455(+)
MTDRKEPKMSAVAMMENWKSAVMKEGAVASVFEENWGYLKAKPEEIKARKFESRRVKYFNHGKATVIDKRIPLEQDSDLFSKTPETPEHEKIPDDPSRFEKTMNDARWRPTNYEYGSRGSLELFGVCDHGIKATITKQPR